MDSASLGFIGFGLLAAILSNLRSSARWRTGVLLLASLSFIGLLLPYFSLSYLLPMAGFLLLGYIGISLAQRGWSKTAVGVILAVIATYIWLKRYSFLSEASFLHFPYLTLGLSYIFFRVLHLLIESGHGDEQRQIGPTAYLTYLLNFTTLVSGPIQRYDDFAHDQFADQPIKLGWDDVGRQLSRIVVGFFKVNVVAMLLHAFQQDALTELAQPLPVSARLFAAFRVCVVYPFFLYANFSGYIDIVIAIARLMRLRLPENFNRPFSASSFIDFWNRWHITLSLWLKTYVYNPLLLFLMRRISSSSIEPYLGVFCFFVTFFLVGIWHGRTSEFALFGVLQGGGVAMNKLWQINLTRVLGRKRYKQLTAHSIYVALGRGLTFSWFAFTLFWFWADWKQIDGIFYALSAVQWMAVWTTVWLSATVTFEAWEQIRAALLSIRSQDGPVLTNRYAIVVYTSILALAGLIITVVLNQPAPDVVYKTF